VPDDLVLLERARDFLGHPLSHGSDLTSTKLRSIPDDLRYHRDGLATYLVNHVPRLVRAFGYDYLLKEMYEEVPPIFYWRPSAGMAEAPPTNFVHVLFHLQCGRGSKVNPDEPGATPVYGLRIPK